MSVLGALRSSFLWGKAWVIQYIGESGLNSSKKEFKTFQQKIQQNFQQTSIVASIFPPRLLRNATQARAAPQSFEL